MRKAIPQLCILVMALMVWACSGDDDTARAPLPDPPTTETPGDVPDEPEEPEAPVPPSGTLYIATSAETRVLDMSTGDSQAPLDIPMADVARDGSVLYYVDSEHDNVVATQLGPEGPIWDEPVPFGADQYTNLTDAKILLHNGILYVSYRVIDSSDYLSEYHLMALDAATGASLANEVSDKNANFMIVDGDKLITMEWDHGYSSTWSLRKRDLATLAVEQEVPLPSSPNTLTAYGEGFIVNFVGGTTVLYNSSLEEQWQFENAALNYSEGLVVGDQYYFSSWDHNLYCLDADDGTEIWKLDTQSNSSDVLFASGEELFWLDMIHGTDSDATALVNAGDVEGGPLWSAEVPLPDLLEPPQALLIPSGDYMVLAIMYETTDLKSTLSVRVLKRDTGDILWEQDLVGVDGYALSALILEGEDGLTIKNHHY